MLYIIIAAVTKDIILLFMLLCNTKLNPAQTRINTDNLCVCVYCCDIHIYFELCRLGFSLLLFFFIFLYLYNIIRFRAYQYWKRVYRKSISFVCVWRWFVFLASTSNAFFIKKSMNKVLKNAVHQPPRDIVLYTL